MDPKTETQERPTGRKTYESLEELRAAHRASSARYRERKRAESGEPPKRRGRPPVYASPEEKRAAANARKTARRHAARYATLATAVGAIDI